MTRPSAKTTLADWTAEGEENDVNGFYGGEKRQRGGRKKRKKNKEMSHVLQNWDDIYDPSRPNNYEDYKHSDEKIIEMREWKNKLYAHRISKRHNSDSDSSGDDFRPQTNSKFPSLSLYRSLYWAQSDMLHLLSHLPLPPSMPATKRKLTRNLSTYLTVPPAKMLMLDACDSHNLPTSTEALIRY